MALSAGTIFYAGIPAFTKVNTLTDAKQYLMKILYTRKEVDDWFAGKAFPFSKYHSEFGWLLNNASFKDGIDDSISTYTYIGEDGERIMSNYSEKTCRINTYGNSFTQCHQVSDHETWQEVLAAHLQEPVRNFGVGGWSVYQAYLRMLKEESRKPAEYIIFNIYDDDHKRNLDSWRNIRVRKHPQHIEATLPYVKVDMTKDRIIPCQNPCPTPESYYDLCDLDSTYQLFKDDFVLNIMLAHQNSEHINPDQNYSELLALIKTHGIKTAIDDSETLALQAEKIHQEAAIFSSKKIVESIESFVNKHNKKILFVLSYPGKSIARYIKEGVRFDQVFVDFLKQKKLPFIDLMEKHKIDYLQHRLEIKEYIDKYYIGHYTPLGNLFCAFAIKDKLVAMLDPKPIPYR
jgi:hypothetical protein